MNASKQCRNYKSEKRSILGIMFILVGSVLIANKLDLIPDEIRHYLFTWQMLLIALGSLNLIFRNNSKTGIILICIGVVFLLPRIFPMEEQLKDLLWPVAFIVVGGVMLMSKRKRPKISINVGGQHSEVGSDTLDELVVFGGNKSIVTSSKFQGGKVTVLFGGSEINLMQANMDNTESTIDIITMFGGCELIVPPHWEVQVEVVSIFGAFEDHRSRLIEDTTTDKKVLRLKGFVFFGGGEIKSY